MTSRSSGYSAYEDVLLCQIYMDISQDPIIGVYQSADRFWSRIEDEYNNSKAEGLEHRTKRSLQSRMQIIEKAVRKLNGCIRQVENTNPSGASEQDILDRAKLLLMQDKNYKKGFKFDHVWNMVKNFEKFKNDASTKQTSRNQTANVSSESDNAFHESYTPESPGLSSFPVNLNTDGDNSGGSSSGRPMGVKKSKFKKKMDEQLSTVMNNFKEENRKLLEMFKKTSEDRQQQLQIQKQNLALKQLREENKILMMDLNAVADPNTRAFLQAEQARIIEKRAQQEQPQPPSTSNMFGHYFTNIGGDGTDLPDY